MKCLVCNKTNKVDAAICIHCGAKMPVEEYFGETERNTVGKYKMAINKKIFITLIGFLTALVIFLIILLINPKNEPQQNTGVILSQQSSNNSQNESPQTTSSESSTATSTPITPQRGSDVVTATVKDYRLRLRSKPDSRSTIVDHLPKGAIVIVLAKSEQTTIRLGNKMVKGFWYKIKWDKPLEDSKVKPTIGWVWGDFLIFSNN